MRSSPNILITGTPGTGKSRLASTVAEKANLKHIDVSALAADLHLYDGKDKERNCGILDDDKVIDELEPDMEPGGNVVDFHGSEFFPERWFDLVIVLRTDNTTLYDRLAERGYGQAKITENIECEIFGVLLEEAQNSYPKEIVQELSNNTDQDFESNLERILQWINTFKGKS